MRARAITIARLEFVSAARMRWIRLLAAAFGLLAVAAAWSAGAASDLSGPEGFARTTMTLVPVVLILVPLAALVLGISGQAAEEGSEPFLFGQPVGRGTIVIGRWMGQAAALAGAVVAGLGVGGALVAFNAGVDGVVGYVFFIVAIVVLALIFLSIAAAIASATTRRATALSIGTFVWFLFVLLYDGAALSVAGWLNGPVGARILFASVFANPADLVRVVVLSVSGTPNVLGAAGEAWLRFLGGAARAGSLLTVALAVWTIAPLAIGVHTIRARDL
jgi:Cu-processing system permease protein